MDRRKTPLNTGFASGGLTCKLEDLYFYSSSVTAKFEITPDQKVKVALHFYAVQDMTIKELTLEGVKAFKY